MAQDEKALMNQNASERIRKTAVTFSVSVAAIWARYALVNQEDQREVILSFLFVITALVALFQRIGVNAPHPKILYLVTLLYIALHGICSEPESLSTQRVGENQQLHRLQSSNNETWHCSLHDQLPDQCTHFFGNVSSIFTTDDNLFRFNMTRQGLVKFWFESDIRERIALELLHLDAPNIDVRSCFSSTDMLICRHLLLQPCSPECGNLPPCQDISCNMDKFSCGLLWQNFHKAQSGIHREEEQGQADNMNEGVRPLSKEGIEQLSLLIKAFMDLEFFKECRSNSSADLAEEAPSCANLQLAPVNPCSYHIPGQQPQASGQDSGLLRTCIGADPRMEVGLTLFTSAFAFVSSLRATFPKNQPLQLAIFLSLCFMVPVLVTVLCVIVALTSVAEGFIWEPSSLSCVVTLMYVSHSLFSRILLVPSSRRGFLSLSTEVMDEFKPGGRLFHVPHMFVGLMEMITQFVDLTGNIAVELDFRWVVGFSLLLGLNMSLFPMLLGFKLEKLSVIFSIACDLAYLLLKYFSRAASSRAAVSPIEMLSFLFPLLSLSHTCIGLYDWYVRHCHAASITPHDNSDSSSSGLENLAVDKNPIKRKLYILLKLLDAGNHHQTKAPRRRGSIVADLNRTRRRSMGLMFCWRVFFAIPLFVAGALLQGFVIYSVFQTHSVCHATYGTCLWQGVWPKMYFAKGLFAPSCSPDHVLTINGSHCGLVDLPEAIRDFTSPSIVDLRGNPLREVPRWVPFINETCSGCVLLDQLAHVEHADWASAGLRKFPLDTVRHLPSLKILNVSMNKLEDFPRQLGDIAPYLRDIDLSFNQVRFLDASLINCFKGLASLNASHNALSFLPEPMLERYFEPNPDRPCLISVAHNPIKSLAYEIKGKTIHFPYEMQTLSSLDTLKLSCLPTAFPPISLDTDILTAISSARSVVFVSLLNGTLPSEVAMLSNLQTLDISRNRLTGTIPEELGTLVNLTSILLGGNALRGSLPSSIGNLGKLKILHLANNLLTGAIPSEMTHLSRLEGLFLDGNRFAGNIPTEVGKLSRLALAHVSFFGVDGNTPRTLPTELGKLSRLTSLDISSSGMRGSLPTELGRLTRLGRLSLDGNYLTGTIPAQIGRLKLLRKLGLADNRLHGTLPDTMWELVQLESIMLNSNMLAGKISSSIGQLSALRWLDLSGNRFTGTIPAQVWSLSNLEELNMSNNGLIGTLPVSLGARSIQRINLSYNKLGGTIPAQLAQIRAIDLRLAGNDLSGSIPSEIFNNVGLVRFQVSDNLLTGSIPQSVSGAKSLRTFEAEKNALTGTIPEALFHLPISFLKLASNQLHGTIPEAIGQAASLGDVQLGHNSLTGTLPTNIGDLGVLTSLNIQSNDLRGTIPTELGRATSLQEFSSQENKLSGSLPTELGELVLLTSLQLYSNRLTGGVPTELGWMSSLRQLQGYSNGLMGTIPTELGNLNNLYNLELDDNALEGSIPSELSRLSGLVALYLGWNKLTGTIPTELGLCKNLIYLLLLQNQLNGTLPSELGELTEMNVLYLSGNEFTGSIPSTFGDLTNLADLAIEQNKLVGTVPTELGQLTKLAVFTLANNQLTGTLPSEIQALSSLSYIDVDSNLNHLAGRPSRPYVHRP